MGNPLNKGFYVFINPFVMDLLKVLRSFQENSIQLEFMNYKKENYGKFFEKIKRG